MTYILSELVNRTLTILTVDTTLANENYVPHLSALGTSAFVFVQYLYTIFSSNQDAKQGMHIPHIQEDNELQYSKHTKCHKLENGTFNKIIRYAMYSPHSEEWKERMHLAVKNSAPETGG